MPGRQTVPRAELWGAIQVVSRVDEKTDIEIPIDAKYVTKGIIHGESCNKGHMETRGRSLPVDRRAAVDSQMS